MRFLSRLFRRHRERDDSALIREDWRANFIKPSRQRFVLESGDGYRSEIRDRTFCLELYRTNLFAWVDNAKYRYRDFFIETELSITPESGHSAAGFLLRRIDDGTFYYFLVSNRGYFRFDVVTNGSPRQLIDWTACEQSVERAFIRIVVRDTNFSFYLGDDWLGEVDDDSIDAGGLAFAVQNYGERTRATGLLHEFRVNSIPYDVETQFYRWARYIPIEQPRRLRLAETFMRMEQFTAALVQLRRAMRRADLDGEGYLLLAECEMRLGLRDSAEDHADHADRLLPEDPRALTQKANLLYLGNRFEQLRDHLSKAMDKLADDPAMWNLQGNAWYSLGNWAKASASYTRACEIEPETALFWTNAARARERLDDTAAALKDYLHATRLLFREDEFDRLEEILPTVERLGPVDPEVQSLKAKLLFHNENYDQAEPLLEALVRAGADDSSVHFLYGLILARNDRRAEAGGHLLRAAELEPDFYLYWFRAAENSYLESGDPGPALEKALETGATEAWVNNLAGQIEMEKGNHSAALDYLRVAWEISPREVDIAMSYAEALFKTGEREPALTILAEFEDEPRAYNLRGNLMAEAGSLELAIEAYERAVSLEPTDVVYAENCAAACLELDMIHRAEELLARVSESAPSARIYTLLGHVARRKGEYRRAVAAYEEALALEPGDEQIALGLVDLFLERRDFEQAERILDMELRGNLSPSVERARRRVREATKVRIACGVCEREWWAPKEVTPQPRMKIRAQPPGESPAGQCPECRQVFCIDCVSGHLLDGRFLCPTCGVTLKLSGDHLKYLVSEYLEQARTVDYDEY